MRTRPVSLKKCQKFRNIDARQPAFEQLAQRKIAAAIIHCHDDLIYVIALTQLEQSERGIERRDGQRTRLAVRLDVAHQAEAAPVGTTPQLGYRRCTLTRTVYQHAALEDILVYETRERGTRHSDGRERRHRCEQHDAAADAHRRSDVPHDNRYGDAGKDGGNNAHRQAERAGALPCAV